jgi:predicted MFS family arabinose efflux permease
MAFSTGSSEAASVRRLVWAAAAVILVEASLYTILAPLLVALDREVAISPSQWGLLVASYSLGAALFAIPAAIAARRFGPRAVTLFGLIGLALTSVAFGLTSTYDLLLVSRSVQGAFGGIAWSGSMLWLIKAVPSQRRGAVIGFAFGAGAAASVAGPLVGGLTIVVGRPAVFLAIAAVAACLAGVISLTRTPELGTPAALRLGPALRRPGLWRAILLVLLPSFATGALVALVPLRIDHLGDGAAVTTLIFGAAAAIGILVQPLIGHWSDRAGRQRPIRAALLAGGLALAIAPIPDLPSAYAALSVVALLASEAALNVGMSQLADTCEELGIGEESSVPIVVVAQPLGFAFGSAGIAGLVEIGDAVPYLLLAGILLGAGGAVSWAIRARQRRDGRSVETKEADPVAPAAPGDQ